MLKNRQTSFSPRCYWNFQVFLLFLIRLHIHFFLRAALGTKHLRLINRLCLIVYEIVSILKKNISTNNIH